MKKPRRKKARPRDVKEKGASQPPEPTSDEPARPASDPVHPDGAGLDGFK